MTGGHHARRGRGFENLYGLFGAPGDVENQAEAGERGFEVTKHAYQELEVDATVVAFIDDMAAAYAWSDLAVCRASGAVAVRRRVS